MKPACFDAEFKAGLRLIDSEAGLISRASHKTLQARAPFHHQFHNGPLPICFGEILRDQRKLMFGGTNRIDDCNSIIHDYLVQSVLSGLSDHVRTVAPSRGSQCIVDLCLEDCATRKLVTQE